ncbi:transposable element Tcb1 transposase [Trichonephila clavipes]|nr:transposable element Tcb1 transposase [Trichonephila clavipes]
MRVWKQWTDEHRTTRKTGSGRRKVTSARDDRHLLSMAVDNRKASSRQLAARRFTATGVLMSASSIRPRLLQRGLSARVPLYRIPLMANHQRLRLQWAREHRAWQADWHQVVFSDESHFNLWDHDGHIRIRRYAGERCLPECVIGRHSCLTLGVMVWSAISYHGRFNLLISTATGRSVKYYSPKSFPFFKASLEQDNARPHVAKTVRDFCSAQHMQLLPWPAYSLDMSHIEHMWDLVTRRLTRDLRPAASKDELLQRIQAIWTSLPQADIQNLF